LLQPWEAITALPLCQPWCLIKYRTAKEIIKTGTFWIFHLITNCTIVVVAMNVVAKAVFIAAVVFATVGHGASLNIIWQKK
jgi:hypothetical protein